MDLNPNPQAWMINMLDSSLSVLFEAGYRELADGRPAAVEEGLIADFLRLPYDHFR
jgi:hypothetical protein